MFARSTAVLILCLGAAACGSSSTSPSSNPNFPNQVTIPSNASTLSTTAYSPNPITVGAGGTVTWVNNDNTTHTATATDNSWNSGNIAPGGNFSRTFPTAGTFQYNCTIHPNMVGTVTVQ